MITSELAKQLIDYDSDSGSIVWRHRPDDMFKSASNSTTWNKRFAGNEAGSINKTLGYRLVSICGKKVWAHRLAWLVYFGSWPNGQIDHINHDKNDNRISNLRIVSHVENGRNANKKKNNKTGVTGVSWYKRKNKFAAEIMSDSGRVFLGYFADLNEARKSRKDAEIKLGYHENHGIEHEGRK